MNQRTNHNHRVVQTRSSYTEHHAPDADHKWWCDLTVINCRSGSVMRLRQHLKGDELTGPIEGWYLRDNRSAKRIPQHIAERMRVWLLHNGAVVEVLQ